MVSVAVNYYGLNHLTDRKQFVALNGKSSLLTEVLLGVPQGSILGPLLFLLYIKDLPLASKLFALLFADDTTLLASSNSVESFVEFVNIEFKKKYVTFSHQYAYVTYIRTKLKSFFSQILLMEKGSKSFVIIITMTYLTLIKLNCFPLFWATTTCQLLSS